MKFTEEIYDTDGDGGETPEEEREDKKRRQRQQDRGLEATGLVRAHSERIELRHGLFDEDEKDRERAAEPPGAAANAHEGRDDETNEREERLNKHLWQDDDEMQEQAMECLANFKGDLNDPEAVEAALAEHMQLLHLAEMQEAQDAQDAQEAQQKQEGQKKDGRGQRPKASGGDDAKHDFNKLQNIGNLREIAQQVSKEEEEAYLNDGFDEYDKYH